MTSPGQIAGTAKDEAATQASRVAGTARDEVAGVASTATSAAGDVAGTAKQEVGNVVGTAAEQAKQLTGTVKEQAQQQVQQGSQKATEALRGLGKQLEEGDTSGLVGTVLSEASKRVQTFADSLEELGPQGLLEQASSYARRNPGTFLLGMAVAGFVTGRLTKGLSAGSGAGEQLALPPGPSSPGYGATGYADLGTSGYETSGAGLTGYGTGTDYGTGYTPSTDAGYTTGTGYTAGGYATGAEPVVPPVTPPTTPPYAGGSSTYGSAAPDLGTPYPETDQLPIPDGTTTRGAR